MHFHAILIIFVPGFHRWCQGNCWDAEGCRRRFRQILGRNRVCRGQCSPPVQRANASYESPKSVPRCRSKGQGTITRWGEGHLRRDQLRLDRYWIPSRRPGWGTNTTFQIFMIISWSLNIKYFVQNYFLLLDCFVCRAYRCISSWFSKNNYIHFNFKIGREDRARAVCQEGSHLRRNQSQARIRDWGYLFTFLIYYFFVRFWLKLLRIRRKYSISNDSKFSILQFSFLRSQECSSDSGCGIRRGIDSDEALSACRLDKVRFVFRNIFLQVLTYIWWQVFYDNSQTFEFPHVIVLFDLLTSWCSSFVSSFDFFCCFVVPLQNESKQILIKCDRYK